MEYDARGIFKDVEVLKPLNTSVAGLLRRNMEGEKDSYEKLAVEATAIFAKFAEEIKNWILINPEVLYGEQAIVKMSKVVQSGYLAEITLDMHNGGDSAVTYMYPRGKVNIDLNNFKRVFESLNNPSNIYTCRAEDMLLEEIKKSFQCKYSNNLEYKVGGYGGVSIKVGVII